MLRTLRLILLVSLIFSLLTACGNKGPLVLPDQKPAPATQSKDKDKDKGEPTKPAPPSSAGGTANSN